MRTATRLFSLTLLPAILLGGCSDSDNDSNPESAASTIELAFVERYSTHVFDESAAEIVDFDPITQAAFVVNANSGQVDVIDASSPSAPMLLFSLNVAADVAAKVGILASQLGAANSVSVYDDTLAVAIEADVKQDNGYIAFYQTDGTFLNALEAGALPDMVTFTPDGAFVIAANEGEPNGDYSNDPEGSITLIDMSAGAAALTALDVTPIGFSAFNAGGLTGPVRISRKAASVAADLEPEYIAVSPDSSTAYVVLQENNAVAVLDIATATVTDVVGLGYKDYALADNEIDPSNRDGGIEIRNVPVFGVYMPDGADAFSTGGETYIVTANEGDGREYLTDAVDAADCTLQGGFDFDDGDCFHYLDEVRIKDIKDNGATVTPDLEATAGTDYEDDDKLGRLKVITDLGTTGSCASLATTGQPEADCTYEAFYSFGARSFTIWNADTFELVFDSGSMFEQITAAQLDVNGFNASNDDNEFDDRSDDKGPEPEAVEIGEIDGQIYAFIGLERVGGVMVFNITTPAQAEFVQYINPRDFSIADVEADLALVGDLGPESIKFVSAEDSPNGVPMLIVGNEVSGTTSFYEITVTDL